MIHHYTGTTHDRTGTYRSIPGAGSHPSAAWLAGRGWYHVAQLPPPPEPGMTWHAADPAYCLVDGLSTPQGEYRETPPDHAAALARYRAEAAETTRALVPAPWDEYRDKATSEYAAWIDSVRDAIAAELARLESAVAAAVTAADLAAITADWPEVSE